MKEAEIQKQIRLESSRQGWRLWRNNNGACQDAITGRQIRYGLGNDSSQLNRHMASSDLIGIIPTVITPDMAGAVIGRFASIEVKRAGWVYSGTAREKAQANWINMVNNLGGYAIFAAGVQDLWSGTNNGYPTN